MTRVLRLWGPAVLYMAFIFNLSAQPEVPIPSRLGDKPVHSMAYAVLAVLFVRALAGGLGRRIGVGVALIAVALTTAYGITDEIHQMFVPGRSPELLDVYADAVGGTAGALVCWLWGIISPVPRNAADPPRHGL